MFRLKLTYHHKVILLIFLAAAVSCKHEPVPVSESATEDRLSIELSWNKAYSDETRDRVETGLIWGLSFLGAELPPAYFHEAFVWTGQHHIRLNLGKAGFTKQALDVWEKLLSVMKQSDEYVKTGSIDLGRFIMLTLNASHHYYKITGVKRTYTQFREDFVWDGINMAIIESAVSKGHRLLYLPSSAHVDKMAFIAAEGEGSLEAGTFHEERHEVFDFMPNGQLRFAIYDENGQLVPSSDTIHTDAGKPAKCLWCHEIVIQQPFNAVTSVPGYYSVDSFRTIVTRRMEELSGFRQTLVSKADFSKRQDHTLMELLYISFMEPSAERLANEWGMTISEVQNKLNGLPTHLHDEFLFLGELYHRREVEAFAPFTGLRVSDNAREPSGYEPDLIP